MSRNWTSYGVYKGEEFCGMARTIRKARAIVRSAGADSVLRWHQTPSQNIVEYEECQDVVKAIRKARGSHR